MDISWTAVTWGVLALILIVAEILVPGAFLLWLGFAAAILFVLTLLAPDLSVLVQVGAKALTTYTDYVFAGLTAAAVFFFHVPVLYALLAFGVIAIWWNRPRDKAGDKPNAGPAKEAGGKDGAP